MRRERRTLATPARLSEAPRSRPINLHRRTARHRPTSGDARPAHDWHGGLIAKMFARHIFAETEVRREQRNS